MAHQTSFLGTGWSFPPTFSQGGGGVHMVTGPEDVEQSLAVLLATRPGERVLQDDFGAELSEFLFAEINYGLLGRLRSVISDAILHHEPRVELNAVDISASAAAEGLLLIGIDYTIRATNSRYNMVYPFYLNEATSPGG